jgi:hypothetical protein
MSETSQQAITRIRETVQAAENAVRLDLMRPFFADEPRPGRAVWSASRVENSRDPRPVEKIRVIRVPWRRSV